MTEFAMFIKPVGPMPGLADASPHHTYITTNQVFTLHPDSTFLTRTTLDIEKEMAATEYYMGTAAAQQVAGQQRPPSYELPTQHHFAQSYSQPPTEHQQSYSPYPSQPPQHQVQARPAQGYPPPPQQHQQQPPQQQPYFPSSPRQHSQQPPQQHHQQPPYFPPPPTSSSQHLGIPLQPHRSHSQPPAPRVRFAPTDDYASDSNRSFASDSTRSYTSDSKTPHRRHKKHHHHHSHHRSSSLDEETRHKKKHKDRDTFLGAGVGGVIGDAIFPGLGTVGGLLLGGYGGRKRAGRKGRREREEEEGRGERYPADWRSDFGNEHVRGGRERYPADYRNDFENEHMKGGRERYPANHRNDFENEHMGGGRDRGGERYPADHRSDFENERGLRGHRDSGYGGEEYGDGKGDWERRIGGSGWDEGSGTYKKGVAVR